MLSPEFNSVLMKGCNHGIVHDKLASPPSFECIFVLLEQLFTVVSRWLSVCDEPHGHQIYESLDLSEELHTCSTMNTSADNTESFYIINILVVIITTFTQAALYGAQWKLRCHTWSLDM